MATKTRNKPDNGLSEAAKGLLDTYLDTLGGSEKTKKNMAIYATAFLRYSGIETLEDMTKAKVVGFLTAIRNEGESNINPLPRKTGVSRGTENFCHRVIRRFYVTNGAEWPFRKGEAPQVRSRDQRQIRLGRQAIEAAIDVAKRGVVDERAAAFIAASTVYGLRASEIADLTTSDFDWGASTLWIRTKKHGREKLHAIPSAIAPVLQRYGFEAPTSLSAMFTIWRSIEDAIGLQHVASVGWHSIRRALATDLWESHVSMPTIQRFLRWQGQSDGNMAVRYHSLAVVDIGHGQAEYHIDQDEIAEDQRIFEVHPYLRLWFG